MNQQEYEGLIADAKAKVLKWRNSQQRANQAAWELGDVLARIPIINQTYKKGVEGVALGKVAADIGLSRQYVSRLRIIAMKFPPDKRVRNVSAAAHYEALRIHGTVEEAIEALNEAKAADGKATTAAISKRDGLLVSMLNDAERFSAAAAEIPSSQRQLLKEILDADVDDKKRVMPRTPERRILMTLRRIRTTLSNLDLAEVEDAAIRTEVRALEAVVHELVEKTATKEARELVEA